MNSLNPSETRAYEVIVWGATGFTGRLVAEYLLERYGAPEKGELRWAIAGRNQAKLEELRAQLGKDAASLPIVTADSHNRESLDALTSQTQVICTTVGPYAKYGSELVAACVRNGTHYCDLAGEVQWMRAMIDRHESDARESGARIVFTCGFDSIPSDLGVYFLQREARERFGAPCSRVKSRVKTMKGGASGGTVASMMNAIKEGRADSKVAKILVAPYSLNPEGMREGPDERDQAGVVWDEDFDSWTAPFVMATINTKVVRRTNAVSDYSYGREFRYDEAMLSGKGIGGVGQAAAIAGGLAAVMVGGAIGPIRSLLERFVLPAPGEGPDANERLNGHFHLQMLGSGPGSNQIRVSIRGDRDPGYGSTSKMLGESAVCLAKDPNDTRGGFWTPASAMGGQLLERLQRNAGLTFTVD